MRKMWMLVTLLFVIAAGLPLSTVEAARGIPGSGEFGYGAHLNLQGPNAEPALDLAGNLPLDWLAVDFNWSALYPSQSSTPDWSALDRAIASAANQQIGILISITSAPAWALTPQGPDANLAAQLAGNLAARYGSALDAIELFPGANTIEGWGAAPDARSYLNLASVVRAQLQQSGSGALLVLAGLKPAAGDLAFLQDLYNNGLAQRADVVSLQLNGLTGDPLAAPDGAEYRYLRHYEEVRQVMLNNQHENGLIWVTHFNAPCAIMNAADQRYQDPQRQAAWLGQAYVQLRSQLYIGAVFYDALNPDPSQACLKQDRTLMIDAVQYHQFYSTLRDLIAENAPEAMLSRRGRPKDGEFIKSRP